MVTNIFPRETEYGNDVIQVYVSDNTGGYSLDLISSDIMDCPPNQGIYNTKIEYKKQEEEIVNPKRYTSKGKLECWDVIIDQEMSYLEGSVLKYLWRYKEKNGVHDLKKAKVYIDKIISEIEKK